MTTNLMQASHEWANRPADERFEKLDDLYLNCLFSHQRAQESTVKTKQLQAVNVDGDLRLESDSNQYRFSNWSHSQFNSRVDGPELRWQRRIPADLAAQNLNYAISRLDENHTTQLYHDRETNKIRSATSDGYARIFNHQVVKAVIDLGDGWKTPPARPAKANQPGARQATKDDLTGREITGGLGIKEGDWIAPAGIYGGDRNIFIFRVNPDMRLDDGSDGGLGRGFFVRNSEVGDASFELVTFWYRYVCGNHIVWGAEEVMEKRIRHTGSAHSRAFDSIRTDLDDLAQTDLLTSEKMVTAAKRQELGNTREMVVSEMFRRFGPKLTKKNADNAYLMSERYRDVDGDPNTVWGYSNGLTRLSQTSKFADERTKLDRVAGEVLALASSN